MKIKFFSVLICVIIMVYANTLKTTFLNTVNLQTHHRVSNVSTSRSSKVYWSLGAIGTIAAIICLCTWWNQLHHEETEEDWAHIPDDQREHQLKDACRNGNEEKVKYLVETRNTSLHEVRNNIDVENPLTIALDNGHQEIAEYIAEKVRNRAPWCLRSAIRFGLEDQVKYFIEKVGFDPHVGEIIRGNTSTRYKPIVLACNRVPLYPGHIPIVKYLVEEQNVEVPYEAIFRASDCGHEELVDYLREHFNKDVAENLFGLHDACKKSFLRMARTLIQDCGYDVNMRDADGNTPMMVVGLEDSVDSSLDIITYLIDECDADISIRNNQNKTILDLVQERGDRLLEECLEECHKKRGKNRFLKDTKERIFKEIRLENNDFFGNTSNALNSHAFTKYLILKRYNETGKCPFCNRVCNKNRIKTLLFEKKMCQKKELKKKQL